MSAYVFASCYGLYILYFCYFFVFIVVTLVPSLFPSSMFSCCAHLLVCFPTSQICVFAYLNPVWLPVFCQIVLVSFGTSSLYLLLRTLSHVWPLREYLTQFWDVPYRIILRVDHVFGSCFYTGLYTCLFAYRSVLC